MLFFGNFAPDLLRSLPRTGILPWFRHNFQVKEPRTLSDDEGAVDREAAENAAGWIPVKTGR